MTSPSRSRQTGEQCQCPDRIERSHDVDQVCAELSAPGIVSLAVPIVLALVIQVIVLVASLSLGQRCSDTGIVGTLGSSGPISLAQGGW